MIISINHMFRGQSSFLNVILSDHISPDVIISINPMFRGQSSFPNVILSADASPCFSIVVSARPQHNKESKNVAVLTKKNPFLTSRSI